MTRVSLSMSDLHPPVLSGTPRKFHGRFPDGGEDDVYSSVCRLLHEYGPDAMAAALLGEAKRILTDADSQESDSRLDEADDLSYLARNLQCSSLRPDWLKRVEASRDFQSKGKALDARLDDCDATRHTVATLLQPIVDMTGRLNSVLEDWRQISLKTWLAQNMPKDDAIGCGRAARAQIHRQASEVHCKTAQLVKRALDCRGKYRDNWFADTTHSSDIDERLTTCVAFEILPGKYVQTWECWQRYDDALADYAGKVATLAKMPWPTSEASQLYLIVQEKIESFADLFCKLLGESNLDSVRSIRRYLQAATTESSTG
ncbi:hypothetical protein [Bordetella genomosp. 13]|uniref:Uncharacterized protein n=1 Tax=Bordetella genomosp. 13 TaxID=463040 RepID=A0A1W6Z6M6_9BORD|nr:hypothetical protein [Bordetella genomosp. 13]ARP93043.1 hypothetical protein CAL15_00795 [Bordetella genomosp. 13]